jgi:hypothetical protein
MASNGRCWEIPEINGELVGGKKLKITFNVGPPR